MKRFTKTYFVFALLVLTLAFGAFRPVQAASKKKGLVKTGGKYYYYVKGKKVKNKWKTLKEDGKKYRFYFGKKGAAYKASTGCVRLYKIGKKKYGFDSSSHLASPGIYATYDFKVVVIGKKGVYDAKKTKSIRKKLNLGHKMDKTIYRTVTDIFGKPLSVKRSPQSCYPWNETDTFTDVILRYKNLDVQLKQNDRTKMYGFDTVFPKETM